MKPTSVKADIIDLCSRELYDTVTMHVLKTRDVLFSQILKENQKPQACTIHVFMKEKVISRRMGSGNAQSIYLDLPTHLEDAMITIQAELESLRQEQNLVEAYLTRMLNIVSNSSDVRSIMPKTLLAITGVSENILRLPLRIEPVDINVIFSFHKKEIDYLDIIKNRLMTNLLLQN